MCVYNNCGLKVDKLNNLILKAFLKDNKNKDTIMIGCQEKNFALCLNGYAVYFGFKPFFPFDFDLLTSGHFKGFKEQKSLFNLLKPENLENAQKVKYLHEFKIDKKQVSVFGCDDFEMYVDNALLNYIDVDKLSFRSQGKNAPLVCYSESEVLAIILPINVKKG